MSSQKGDALTFMQITGTRRRGAAEIPPEKGNEMLSPVLWNRAIVKGTWNLNAKSASLLTPTPEAGHGMLVPDLMSCLPFCSAATVGASYPATDDRLLSIGSLPLQRFTFGGLHLSDS
jgi:hypothetical protein